MCHARVEADAGDVEEQVTVQFARIDQSRASLENHLKRTRWLKRDPEFASETITGPARHDRERGIGADKRRSDFVDRAVAAPRDKRRDAPPKT